LFGDKPVLDYFERNDLILTGGSDMTRIWTAAVAFVAVVALGLCATNTTAAPAPPPTKTVEKFEYCEILTTSGRGAVRPAIGAVQPVQPLQPAQGQPGTIRMTTLDGEIEATSWEDLATKLKAPEGKKDATANTHKMRVMNFLGDQGWEMVSCTQTPTTGLGAWTFKRKVTKEVKETKETKEPKSEK